MNLLLSNDDGVYAPGIAALAKELKKKHQITIAAPDQERSGAGHATTYLTPLRAQRVVLDQLEDVPTYAVTGMPADCARIGCFNLCSERPDIVVAGINRGPNLGSDVFYSGTVAVAMEAALQGFPGIAVSTTKWYTEHWETAAKVAAWAVDYVAKHPLKPYSILNVNVPDVPADQIKGVKLTGLCLEQYEEGYVERKDTIGMKYYWPLMGKLTHYPPDADHDERWTEEGYVSLTPIHFDIADYAFMKTMNVDDFHI